MKQTGKQQLVSSPHDASWNKFREIFGMDVRSMALFRFMLGMVIFGDLLDRARDLRTHYTDEGISPRTLILTTMWNRHWFSFHMMTGHVLGVAAIFTFHAIAALCLALGYRTRLSHFICWIMHLSLMARNIVLLHSGDVYMACIIFFGMFLPLGRTWSVDAMRKRSQATATTHSDAGDHTPRDRLYVSVATFAIPAQIAMLYCFSTWHKRGAPWVEDYTATSWALMLDYFAMPLGKLLFQFPTLCKLLTWAVMKWEWYGPFLFWSPVATGVCKLIGVLGFLALHLGFGLCMRLGTFYWICSTAVLPLLPSQVWDGFAFAPRLGVMSLLRRGDIQRRRVAVYAAHGRPMTLARVFTTFFLLPETKLRPLAAVPTSMSPVDIEWAAPVSTKCPQGTWMAVSIGRANVDADATAAKGHAMWYNWDAVATLVAKSPLLWPLARIATSSPAREFGRWLDRWMLPNGEADQKKSDEGPGDGVSTATKLPTNARSAHGVWPQWRKTIRKILLNGIPLAVLVYCFASNVDSIKDLTSLPPTATAMLSAPSRWPILSTAGDAMHMTQHWGMFSPHPPMAEGWHIIIGQLEGKKKVELFRNEGLFRWQGSEVTYDKPEPFHKSYKNHRWAKYFEHGYNGRYAHENGVRLEFGKWICRQWNSRHNGNDMLKEFYVYWVFETHTVDGGRKAHQPQVLWHHICY